VRGEANDASQKGDQVEYEKVPRVAPTRLNRLSDRPWLRCPSIVYAVIYFVVYSNGFKSPNIVGINSLTVG
jgi:hypothetical protein